MKSPDGKVDYFQLDDLFELCRIIRFPALLLGYASDSQLNEAMSLGADLAVYDNQKVMAIAGVAERLGTRAKVHLAIEVHLGREGILPTQHVAFLSRA